MAAEIDKDYAGKDLLVVGVLRGAVMVVVDLTGKMRTLLLWIGWQFLLMVPELNQRCCTYSKKILILILLIAMF